MGDSIKKFNPSGSKKQNRIFTNNQDREEFSARYPILPRKRDTNIYPLSFAQQRFWFLEQLMPRHSFLNLPLTLRLCGPLEYTALEQGLNELIKRHEVLRTTFRRIGDQPVQVIAPAQALVIPLVDLRGLGVEQATEFQRLATAEGTCPFDLQQGPLLRAMLVQLATQEHILFLTIHHIICDGWSFNILYEELGLLYQAFRTSDTSSLTPLPVQYADYTLWQQQWLQEDLLELHLAYWRAQLQKLPTLIMLSDYPRPEVQSFQGAQIRFALSHELTEQLRALSRREGGTLFQALLAVFQVILSRYSGAEDIVVGTPAANRIHEKITGVIGCFINMLVLRTDLSGNPSLREILARVKQVVREAKEHQALPFEKLVEHLQPERKLNQHPLFQVMITLRHRWVDQMDVEDLRLYFPEVGITQSSQVDLSLIFDETEHGLQGVLEYATDLFMEETMQRLIGHFQVGLTALVTDPDQRLSQLSLLTEAERQQVLVTWNATQQPPSGEQCIHELFEAQVKQTPDAIALVYEEHQLSYAQLNQRANQLAHYLQGRGVGPEQRVGLCLERSLEMVIVLLAILKAGAAYVPLDPSYPQQRLAFLLQDAQISLLLTQSTLLIRLPSFQGQVLCLDHDWSHIAQQSRTNLSSRAEVQQLAYVIYTSGSTGQPKGVMITHANVGRLLAMTDQWFHFQRQDVWTLFHSFAFDFSVWELWGALLYGGRLEVVPYWVSRSPEHFYALLKERGITVLNQTPTAFRQLQMVDAQQPDTQKLALRYVIFGGEELEPSALSPWFRRHGDQHPQLINMYGTTETTIHVTYQPLGMSEVQARARSVIGHPIPDLQCYILDAWQQLVPVGVPGELYVGGRGMARGYWQQAALTAERFVPSPWSTQPGERLYKTGDLVRYQMNGVLEYLGRVDQQVKVRGYRIELGEIEATLCQHPAIHEALVLVHGETAEDRYIVAYAVGQLGVQWTEAELSAFLRERLPSYMVPQRIVHVDRFPLTSNGKLDREALLTLAQEKIERNHTYRAPQTWIEERLVLIWQQVLNRQQISIDENFFALGGHSLLAIQVIARVRDIFQVELPMRTIFECPTIMDLARYIEQIRYQLVEQVENNKLIQMLAKLDNSLKEIE